MLAGVNLTQELHNLQEKKSTLERAVRIAASLEKLNHGLKAVILMGKPTSSISKKSIENIEELDEKTKILPSTKLKEILERLENTVQEKLSLILRITEKEEGEREDAESVDDDIGYLSHDDVHGILHEYLKSAQTAVALKIMLRARGEITKPTKLSLPADEIKIRLTEVDAREKKCRNKVKNEMTVLIHDTEKMLKRDELPHDLREMIKVTHASLEMNLRHIESGGSIDNMPVSIENVEMGGDEADFFEVQPVVLKKKNSELKIHRPVKRPGFFYKLWRWATTPANIGWQDVEEEIKEKYTKSDE